MKKGAILFYLITILVTLFISCSKSDSSNSATNQKYRMDATINGTKYTWENFGTFSLNKTPGCVASKSYILTNVGQIRSAEYDLDVLVKTYRVASDFVVTKGAHSIQTDYNLESSSTCNFDISVGLQQNNKECTLQNTSKVNNITSVSKASETSSYILYKVSGNFSCNFKNSSNVIIPVSGTYTTYVQAFK